MYAWAIKLFRRFPKRPLQNIQTLDNTWYAEIRGYTRKVKRCMRVITVTFNEAHLLTPIISTWYKDQMSVVYVNVQEASRIFLNWLRSPINVVFALVEEIDGLETVVGFIVGERHMYAMCGQDIVSEIGWYVHPEHRGSGKLLLAALEDWTKAQGLNIISSHVLLSASADNGVRAIKALEKMGYAEFERAFYKKLG